MPLKDTIVNDTVELITRIIVVTCPQGQLAARVTREGLSRVEEQNVLMKTPPESNIDLVEREID